MNAEYTTSLLYPGNPYVEALPPILCVKKGLGGCVRVTPITGRQRQTIYYYSDKGHQSI